MAIGGSFLAVERPERETEHSPLSVAEVKNAWSYTSNQPIRPHGVVHSYARSGITLPYYSRFVDTTP